MKYLLPLILVGTLIVVGCNSKQEKVLYGEWIYYYYYGDSMIFQIDTAQLIVRKFAVSKANPERDSVIPFEKVYFYEREGDTFHLEMAVPSDYGVQRVPSSYYIMRHLTTDSLIMAPEMGLDIVFTRYSDKWPAMSKQQMIDKYHNYRWKNSPENQQFQQNLNQQHQQEEETRQQQ